MKDCTANAMPLLPGARSGPVGAGSGITDASSAKFRTKRAGNSLGEIPELRAKVSPSPNEMKWSRQATSCPDASTAPLNRCHPPGR